MSCYRPNLMVDLGEKTSSGKPRYVMRGRADHLPTDAEVQAVGAVLVPCKKCYGCRMDYAHSWADRMILELDSNHGKAIFLTLTYSPEHVPYTLTDENLRDWYTLEPDHLRDFWKRLRYYFPDNRIRYYAVGEYGSMKRTARPHYHAIVYGIDYQDILDRWHDVKLLKYNRGGDPLWTSPALADVWSYGHISFGAVNYHTCAYTARYMQKKQYGAQAVKAYDKYLRKPEFARMSRDPGIGMLYLEEHVNCLDNTSIWLYDGSDRRNIVTPKKFYEKLREIDPEKFENLKTIRQRIARDSFVAELSQQGLSFVDYLELKSQNFKRQTRSLVRNFELEM